MFCSGFAVNCSGIAKERINADGVMRQLRKYLIKIVVKFYLYVVANITGLTGFESF